MLFKSVSAFSLAAVTGLLLSGCSGNGVSAASGPGVRVVNGVSSVSQADVTIGTLVVASPLAYATLSGTPAHPYSIIPTGSQTLSLSNVSTPTVPVASTSLNLLTTQDIDAIAFNAASPQFLVLFDSLQVPSDSEVRLVNASSATGSVDVILIPTGSTVGSTLGPESLAPGAVFPAQTVPNQAAYTSVVASGAYELKLFPAGHDTGTPLLDETVSLPAGVSWTFVVLDPAPGQAAPIVLQVQDNLLHDTSP